MLAALYIVMRVYILCITYSIAPPRFRQTATLVIDKQRDMEQIEYKENPTAEDLVEYFGKRSRVRKMTETEALKLMDVSAEDIAKIKESGIAKTNIYKLAGNSIVVNCLYWIFYKMFINTDINTPKQLTLF